MEEQINNVIWNLMGVDITVNNAIALIAIIPGIIAGFVALFNIYANRRLNRAKFVSDILAQCQ